MTPGYLFHSASFWQSFFKIIQGAPLAGTASFSVFACAAFGAPFHQDFIPLHKSSDHPTSAMCRPFPRSLTSILPNRPAAEKVRHNGIVGFGILFPFHGSETCFLPLLLRLRCNRMRSSAMKTGTFFCSAFLWQSFH